MEQFFSYTIYFIYIVGPILFKISFDFSKKTFILETCGEKGEEFNTHDPITFHKLGKKIYVKVGKFQFLTSHKQF